MRNPKRADQNWETPEKLTWDFVHIEVLMDIRDELKALNRQVRESNFCSLKRDVKSTRLAAARIDRRIAKRISLR